MEENVNKYFKMGVAFAKGYKASGVIAQDAFKENEHPRDKNGRFTAKGGSSKGGSSKARYPTVEAMFKREKEINEGAQKLLQNAKFVKEQKKKAEKSFFYTNGGLFRLQNLHLDPKTLKEKYIDNYVEERAKQKAEEDIDFPEQKKKSSGSRKTVKK